MCKIAHVILGIGFIIKSLIFLGNVEIKTHTTVIDKFITN